MLWNCYFRYKVIFHIYVFLFCGIKIICWQSLVLKLEPLSCFLVTPCVSQTSGHPHKPGSHQRNLRHPSDSRDLFSNSPESHSTGGGAFPTSSLWKITWRSIKQERLNQKKVQGCFILQAALDVVVSLSLFAIYGDQHLSCFVSSPSLAGPHTANGQGLWAENCIHLNVECSLNCIICHFEYSEGMPSLHNK